MEEFEEVAEVGEVEGRPFSCESVVTTEDGRLICAETGEVIGENVIADEPERFFKDDPKSLPRIGKPNTNTRHDRGIGAQLERRRESNPLKRSSRVREKIREGRISKRDVSLITALKMANDLSSLLELPKAAREDIGYIINTFLTGERVSGDRERRCIVAAAVLKVIQLYNLGIARNQVLEIMGVTEDCVWKATNKLHKKGVIKDYSRVYRQGGQRRLLERVETYVSSLVNEILPPDGLRETVRRDSMRFVEAAIKSGKNLYGKKPETIAAAAVYLVARLYGYEHVNQSLVAEKVKIKESNVRKIYRYLIDGMVVLVPL
ncbi:MAG: transcription initiation factor IIB family protein [Acidilobaceae archaeon]|nr:transcription initiation factor IIB family protein [Acidilobaceae archaeon]